MRPKHSDYNSMTFDGYNKQLFKVHSLRMEKRKAFRNKFSHLWRSQENAAIDFIHFFLFLFYSYIKQHNLQVSISFEYNFSLFCLLLILYFTLNLININLFLLSLLFCCFFWFCSLLIAHISSASLVRLLIKRQFELHRQIDRSQFIGLLSYCSNVRSYGGEWNIELIKNENMRTTTCMFSISWTGHLGFRDQFLCTQFAVVYGKNRSRDSSMSYVHTNNQRHNVRMMGRIIFFVSSKLFPWFQKNVLPAVLQVMCM